MEKLKCPSNSSQEPSNGHCGTPDVYQDKELPMTPTPLPPDEAIFQLLREVDHALFIAIKEKGCLKCGGPLDTANYSRKTRGMGEALEIRYSLCCRSDGCRRRSTPRSLRFLGRKVYGAWVVIVALDFCKEFGLKGQVARQTIARWRLFWREQLSEASPFLMWARGALPPGTPVANSPGILLNHFGFPSQESWPPILRFFTEPICKT